MTTATLSFPTAKSSDRAKLEYPMGSSSVPARTAYEVRTDQGELLGYVASFTRGGMFYAFSPSGEYEDREAATRDGAASGLLPTEDSSEADFTAPYTAEVLLGNPNQRTVYLSQELPYDQAKAEFDGLVEQHGEDGLHTIVLVDYYGKPVERRSPGGESFTDPGVLDLTGCKAPEPTIEQVTVDVKLRLTNAKREVYDAVRAASDALHAYEQAIKLAERDLMTLTLEKAENGLDEAFAGTMKEAWTLIEFAKTVSKAGAEAQAVSGLLNQTYSYL